MFHSGKCPHCQNLITQVNVENIEIATGLATSYKGVSYSCPTCSSVLSVEIDPVALKADIVSDLLKALRRG